MYNMKSSITRVEIELNYKPSEYKHLKHECSPCYKGDSQNSLFQLLKFT